MTTNTTYHGWTNRPTWVAYTHISNDPAFMATAMDVAATAYNRQHERGRADRAEDAAENGLFEWLEQFLLGDFESFPPLDRLLTNEIVRDWLSDVDWASLAMAILDHARGHDLLVSDDEDDDEDDDDA